MSWRTVIIKQCSMQIPTRPARAVFLIIHSVCANANTSRDCELRAFMQNTCWGDLINSFSLCLIGGFIGFDRCTAQLGLTAL